MTVEQLKQQYPDTYNAIFNNGVAQERKRILNWLSNADTSNNNLDSNLSQEVNEFYKNIDRNLKNVHL